MSVQVYYLKYPTTFEIHIFQCISTKFEFAAFLQTMSQHAYLNLGRFQGLTRAFKGYRGLSRALKGSQGVKRGLKGSKGL